MTQPTRSPVDERVDLDLAALFGALRASLRWLLPLTLAAGLAAMLVLQLTPSKYRGETKILIEGSEAVYPGDNRGQEEERALLDTEGVASQVQLLTSRDLARRVAKRLDLASIPEFEAGEGGGPISALMVMFGLMRDPAYVSPEERVLKVFYKNLKVYRVEGSRVIAVEFSSTDPERAATVANTIVEEYIALQSAAKRQNTEFAAAALEPQIKRLEEDVNAAQRRAESFRAETGLLVGADNQTLNQQQLGELNSQLSDARADQSEAEAKARLIRELLTSGGSLETASDVLNSPLIQRLRERQVALQARIAELSTTLLANHPQLKALQSQLADFDRQIREEARKIMVGLENDAKIAASRVAAMTENLNELKLQAARSAEDQAKLSQLQREADARAAQLEQLMTRYREADTRRNAETLAADARVISRAAVPLEPYWPKVLPMSVIVALATFLLGAAWVIARQFLSGAVLVRTGYEAHEEENLPTKSEAVGVEEPREDTETAEASRVDADQNAVVAVDKPMLPEPGADAEPTPQEDEAPTVEERAEAPAARLDVPVEAGRPRRVAVLSVDSDEVAQEVTFRLVREAAEEGILPLFLEVRPEMDDPQAVPGFAELLDGTASFAGVIYRDASSRAHVIESGRKAIDDELTMGGRFGLVIEAIDHTYDQVFFDLGLIDDSLISAQILALADKVVVATGGSPAGPELDAALRMLEEHTGAPVVVETARSKTGGTRPRSDMAA
ncbi:succinoglycan transporter [Stappia sp. F7233]|uniref:Succinoglycan transporter n=1 Tax=Stappia albiluteola TaxID=2758565 RepID=A0A839AAQ9_9HYPH|nr:exopolysaccharide transport family protein [Stappia albiluteola]MBA5776128.1 succinoglycan transporter [Stappia albiluteola]